MSLPDLVLTGGRIDSPLFQGALDQFKSRNGKFVYKSGYGTHYIEDETDLAKAGQIVIDPGDVKNMLQRYKDADEAVRAILIHEMGHFMYRLQTRATKPKTGASDYESVDWCMKREAQASMFAYRVVKELKARKQNGHVLAPTAEMDIFAALAEAERKSENTLQLAYNAYVSNRAYDLMCRSKLAPPIPQVRIVGKRPTK